MKTKANRSFGRPAVALLALLALAFTPMAYGQANLFWTVDQLGITDGPGTWNQGSPSITSGNGAWYDNISLFDLTMQSGDNVTVGGGTAGAAGLITIGAGGVNPGSLTINQAFDSNSYVFTNNSPADGITMNYGFINNLTNTYFACPVNGSFSVNNPGAANTYVVLQAAGNQSAADTISLNGRLQLAPGGGVGAAAIVLNSSVLNYQNLASPMVTNPVSGSSGAVQYYFTNNFTRTVLANQTYSGGLQLYPDYNSSSPGTLAMGAANVLSANSDLGFMNASSNNIGVTVDLAGYDQTLNSITGTFASTNGLGVPIAVSPANCIITNSGSLATLTLGTPGNGATKTFNAGIFGPVNLVLNGSSILNLGGAIDITGDLTVNSTYSAAFCALSPQSNGVVNLPTGTLNLTNGTLNLNSYSTVSVQTLLATNNTATTTNSIFNWSRVGGTLITSNLNGIAANIVMQINPPNYNATWIMNGGTNYVSYPYVNGSVRFTLGSYGSYVGTHAAIIVNSNAVFSLTNSTGTNTTFFMGGYANNNQLIINGGTVKDYLGQLLVGYNVTTNNLCMVTNGGTLYGGVSVGNTVSSVSNSFVLVGSASRMYGNGAGLSVAYGSATIDGGMATNVGVVSVGGYTSQSNNTLTVINGGQLYGSGNAQTGGRINANNNSILISGAGSTWGGANWSVFIANSAGVFGNSLTIDGGVVTNLSSCGIGNAAGCHDNNLLIANGGQLYAGLSSGVVSVGGGNGSTNTMTVAGPGSLLNQANNLYVGVSTGGAGNNAIGNSLVISNGATVMSGNLCIGRLNAAGGIVTNNYVIVGGGGASAQVLGPVIIGFSSGVTNNYLLLNAGGIISNSVITIGVAGSGGSKLYFNGGTVVARGNGSLTTTAADGQNLIQAGGAIIDDNGYAVTASLPLNQDPNSTGGGLTKQGTGSLTLSGPDTYTGGTTVSAGTLLVNNVTGSGTGSGAVTVNSGATLGGGGIIGGGVTFAAGAFATNTEGSPLTINGPVSLNSTVMQVSTPTQLAVGNYLLITNTAGTITGAFNATPVISGAGVAPSSSGTIVTTASAVILQVAPSVTLPATGTNITYSITGKTLNLSWPTNYIGWELLSNSVAINASNAWYLVAGSTTTNSEQITINPLLTNVFYRMQHP